MIFPSIRSPVREPRTNISRLGRSFPRPNAAISLAPKAREIAPRNHRPASSPSVSSAYIRTYIIYYAYTRAHTDAPRYRQARKRGEERNRYYRCMYELSSGPKLLANRWCRAPGRRFISSRVGQRGRTERVGFWWKPESRCAMPAWNLARAEEVSRRSVLAALWYYLLLGDVEANFTRKFSFFSFFFFFVLQRATISRKVTLSLSLSFFFSFFSFDTIEIGLDWSRSFCSSWRRDCSPTPVLFSSPLLLWNYPPKPPLSK